MIFSIAEWLPFSGIVPLSAWRFFEKEIAFLTPLSSLHILKPIETTILSQ